MKTYPNSSRVLFVWLAVLALLPAAVLPGRAQPAQLIGVAEIPPGDREPRTGGLSGLDYDATADAWFAVSDDKDPHAVRGYQLTLDYDASALRAVRASAPEPVVLPDGLVPDLESIRLDARTGDRWYASEGDATANAQPAVWRTSPDGTHTPLPLPPGFRYDSSNRAGLRPNQAIEALALTDAGTIWTATEGPLWEDDTPASFDRGARVRLTEQRPDGRVVRQLAYAVEPVPPMLAGGRRATNGVSELLWFPSGKLLVLERAGAEFSPGEWRFAARLFWVDLAHSDNATARKQLCFDFAEHAPARVDNLEGLACGRRLADGRETLVVISDDNFSPHQTTEVWVLALPALAFNPTARLP